MSKRILSAIIIVSLYLAGCGTDVSSYFIGKYCDIEGGIAIGFIYERLYYDGLLRGMAFTCVFHATPT